MVPALAALSCQSGSSPELDALSKLADMTTVTDLTAVINEPDASYYIEPMVRARIAEYVDAQVEAAESGIPATVPDRVPVVISNKSLNGDWDIGWEAIHEFLDSNGAVDFDEGQAPAGTYTSRSPYFPSSLNIRYFPKLCSRSARTKSTLIQNWTRLSTTSLLH